jgi:hypothetical protein
VGRKLKPYFLGSMQRTMTFNEIMTIAFYNEIKITGE